MTNGKDLITMTDACCCPPEAGNQVCDLPASGFQRSPRPGVTCPECGKTGKPVEVQTVKVLLSISLRETQDARYFFCRTQTCPVVYFPADSGQVFTVDQVRERVYQKQPEAEDVFVCYCFRHTAGSLRNGPHEERIGVLDDINTGINSGQCACDLRNPQGSCCLGNVRALIKQVETQSLAGA